MVEERKDADRKVEDGAEAIAPEGDPTLDIVRQMIVAAEAIPAPARRPRGPTTPRPERGAVVPPAAPPAPVEAPVEPMTPAVEPSAGRIADAQDQDRTVPADAGDWAVSADAGDWAVSAEDGDWDASEGDGGWDAAEDGDWDAAADDGDWDDMSYEAVPRSYGIVDPTTGARVSEAHVGEEWVADGGDAQKPPRERRPSITGRLIRGLVRLVARGLGAVTRVLWRWMRRVSTALWRRVASFMRRPEAPRRLALALIVFSLFVWTTEVLWLTLLIPLVALITWASVGNEGCVELVIAWFNRVKARDAAKAERIRARAAAVTRGLNRGIERLPQSWTQGLYLPDFETDGYVPEKLKVDPFEELAARVHSAKRAGEH